MPRRNTVSFAVSVGCIAGGVLLAATSLAGPEKIAYPAGWEQWERYNVVDRYDTKRYHELYARSEIVNAVREGKPIPHGSVLVLAMYAAEVDEKSNPVKDVSGPDCVKTEKRSSGVSNGVHDRAQSGDGRHS